MRITESRMIQTAGRATRDAQSKLAETSDQLGSGVKVARPSQDPAAWATAKRAEAVAAVAEGRRRAYDAATTQLTETEGALTEIGDALSRARELAVQASSAGQGADERVTAAAELRQLRAQVLAASNRRGASGEYLLAGSQGGAAPFDADGVYAGDAIGREIATSGTTTQRTMITGSVMTAASGVDVFASIDALIAALDADTLTGIQQGITDMGAAHDQVVAARSDLGALHAALIENDKVAQSQRDLAEGTAADAVGIDPVEAATEFARASQALTAAQAVATQIVALTSTK